MNGIEIGNELKTELSYHGEIGKVYTYALGLIVVIEIKDSINADVFNTIEDFCGRYYLDWALYAEKDLINLEIWEKTMKIEYKKREVKI